MPPGSLRLGTTSGSAFRDVGEKLMATTVACRRCGWGITPDMPERLCGRCLLAPVLDTLGDDPIALGAAAPGDSPADAPLPSVPGYRIVRFIGAGAVGEVYEAEQHHPRRPVALKLLKPSVGTRETLRRLRYEADVLGRLQHPGIAQIYESGSADGSRHGRPSRPAVFRVLRTPRKFPC
jgi:hypothetical protein